MTALEQLLIEIGKHDVMRAHSSLLAEVVAESKALSEDRIRLQAENWGQYIELIQQDDKIASMDNMVEIAQEIWGWIQNWEPPFVEDPEWKELEERYLDALEELK